MSALPRQYNHGQVLGKMSGVLYSPLFQKASNSLDRETIDDQTGFDAMKVSTSNGETAYVVFKVRTYGQGGPEPECFGVFPNLREFWMLFKDDGWLDTSKISNRRILELWPKDQPKIYCWLGLKFYPIQTNRH